MISSASPIPVRHTTTQQRFESQADGAVAFLSYTHQGDHVCFGHTFVPALLRGRGMAGVLVRAALDEARARQWKVVPRCSYVAAFLKRHPECADLLDAPKSASR